MDSGEFNVLKARIASLEPIICDETKVKILWEKLEGLKAQDRQSRITELWRLN